MIRRSPKELASQAEADRFIRRRKLLFRVTIAGASALTILLLVVGIGAYESIAPSHERLLPPPGSSSIPVPVNLSDASLDGVPLPTRLLVPAIGVDASVVPLGRNANGTAQVPSSVTNTGWYDLGPRPGELGPAVILGHVDSRIGPGVFYRLRSLLPGDIVTVVAGGQSIQFEVSRLLTYAKSVFPTAAVFGPTPDAELRLITCTGPFDFTTGHYIDNLIVFAIRIK